MLKEKDDGLMIEGVTEIETGDDISFGAKR